MSRVVLVPSAMRIFVVVGSSLLRCKTILAQARIQDFFRRGCTRFLLYFNTNKPHTFFFCRIPGVLENRRSSQGWEAPSRLLPLGRFRPRRPRGSQSGREKRQDERRGETVRRLGTIIQSIFCAQSGGGIRLNFWK